MNWMKSREAKTPPPVTDNEQVINSKRAWQAGDVNKDTGPNASQSSKRAIKEKENEFFLGGMRNPDLTVAKMHLVRSVGADISRAWNHFLEEHRQWTSQRSTAEQTASRPTRTWDMPG